ncbi:MAG: sensor histidine kinase, partial [Bacteroidetes bacterium]
MSLPPLDLKALYLASHVTKVFGVIHRVAYAMIRPDLTVSVTSDNFFAVLNEPSQSVVGRPLPELMWEFVGVEKDLLGVLNGRLPFIAFERINRPLPNGKTSYLDFTVTAIRDNDLGQGLLLIVEDVTHTAEMEQQLTQSRNELILARQQLARSNMELRRVNRLKSLFLSMAVHDLRAPLTAIRAYGDLVVRTLPENAPENLRKFATMIHTQAARLDWLIDDFLDLDQIEQGNLNLVPKPVDLNELVQEVAAMMAFLSEQKQQNLEISLAAEPIIVMVDPNRIRQILYNLMSNAIKYTPNGGKVSVYTQVEQKEALLIVADTGRGMTKGEQSRAFQIYYRTEETANSEIRGKGLGLFIVKTLVEAHGGTVSLSSVPN